jgi:hypothetical protein
MYKVASKGSEEFNYWPFCSWFRHSNARVDFELLYALVGINMSQDKAWVNGPFGYFDQKKVTRPIKRFADQRAQRRLVQKRGRVSYIVVPNTINTVAPVDHAHNRLIGRKGPRLWINCESGDTNGRNLEEEVYYRL